jgi:hypothetical protein
MPASVTDYFTIDCTTGILSFDREKLQTLASTSSDTIVNVQVVLTEDSSVNPITNKYFSTFLIA